MVSLQSLVSENELPYAVLGIPELDLLCYNWRHRLLSYYPNRQWKTDKSDLNVEKGIFLRITNIEKTIIL